MFRERAIADRDYLLSLAQMSDEERYQIGLARSLEISEDLGFAVSNLRELAFTEFGRVEDMTTLREGNCMLDAALHQMVLARPELDCVDIRGLRETCVEWVMASYGHTDEDGLIASGRHTSWKNWEENMLTVIDFVDLHWLS
jgi:hypothetical protein